MRARERWIVRTIVLLVMIMIVGVIGCRKKDSETMKGVSDVKQEDIVQEKEEPASENAGMPETIEGSDEQQTIDSQDSWQAILEEISQGNSSDKENPSEKSSDTDSEKPPTDSINNDSTDELTVLEESESDSDKKWSPMK